MCNYFSRSLIQILLNTYKTIRYLTVFQQGIIVLFLLIFKYTILLWIDKLLTIGNYGLSVYWIPLVSAIIWPIIFFSLRSIRRRYNISMRILNCQRITKWILQSTIVIKPSWSIGDFSPLFKLAFINDCNWQ